MLHPHPHTALSSEQRATLFGDGDNYSTPVEPDYDDEDRMASLLDVPAGEEATIESGAGGEIELCQDILDELRAIP